MELWRTMLKLDQSDTYSYIPRTITNAESSDVTLAFCDKNFKDTSGEKLTKKHSKVFFMVEVPSHVNFASGAVLDAFRGIPAPTLNIAGNSIGRFPKHMTQNNINAFVYDVIRRINSKHKIGLIRSGGQTGADWAGIIAGVALEIDVIATFPKHFRQRDYSGSDFTSTEQQISDRIRTDLDYLSLVLL